MHLPTPPVGGATVVALAEFVRARLNEVGGTLAPLLRARAGMEILPASRQLESADSAISCAARNFASAVVAAAGPFAPTSYARTRLIRQMHASGLLTADEVRRTTAALDAAHDDSSLDRMVEAF